MAALPIFTMSRICSLFLLSFALVAPARADLTMVLGAEGAGGATHQVHVREGKVSVANAFDKRVLVFDPSSPPAIVVDHRAKEVIRLDRDSLARAAAALLETRREYLAGLEDRLRDASKEEREKLRPVLDVLHRANDPAAATLPEALRFEPTGEEVVHLGKKVQVARVLEGEEQWGTARLGDRGTLEIEAPDYEALVRFQRYFESLTKGLPNDLRARFGQVGLVAPDGEILLAVKEGEGEEGEERFEMEVLAMDLLPVEEGWFAVPGNYAPGSLVPGEKTRNLQEKAPEKALEK